jgi:sulfite exporter TauE/SafE
MISELQMPTALFVAFMAGLLGSLHCAGMCGGIVGALTLRVPNGMPRSLPQLLPCLLSYNAGRIASYTVAGTVAGLLGSQAFVMVPLDQAQLLGRWISALFMIAMGLYIAGWSYALLRLERLGAHVWRWIEPLGRRYLPVTGPRQALMVGLVWGWLPCGLVYAVLMWALVAGSAAKGAVLMLAFGAGTLPMLLAMGVAAKWLGGVLRSTLFRRAVGTAVIIFGVFALFAPHTHPRVGDAVAEATGSAVMPSVLTLQHDTRHDRATLSGGARVTQADH